MAALLFLTSLAFLAINSAQARFLSSENWHNKIAMIIDYGKPILSPPPSPRISTAIHEPTSTNSESNRHSPPLSLEQSLSEIQLQIGTPRAGGNPYGSSTSRPFFKIENGHGKCKLSPPKAPKPSRPLIQIEKTNSPCVIGKAILSPPPPPTSSKSPIQSKVDSPCIDGTPCSSSRSMPFIAAKTDYGREELSPPPPPKPSELPIHTEKTNSPCAIGRATLSPPPPPESSKSPKQSEIGSPCVSCSSRPFIEKKTEYGREKHSPPPSPKPSKPPTHTKKTGSPCVIEKDKLSPPPPPTSSKSPEQSENIGPPCVSCSSSRPFIATKTEYGREKLSPPSSPKPSKSPIHKEKRGSPCVTRKHKLSPPPPPTSSKPPKQSENTGSQCAAGNGKACSSFISMVIDHNDAHEQNNHAFSLFL